MSLFQIAASAAAILWIAVLAAPIARWTRMPLAAVQVVLGFLGVTLVVSLGIDTGLRFTNFHDLIVYVLLPLVVFAAAVRIDLKVLFSTLAAANLVAVLSTLATVFVGGYLIYLGIDHPVGFPLEAALLTGALLAATDPAAFAQHLRDRGAGERLVALLEGESLLNDALAVVLFTAVLTLALQASTDITFTSVSVEFLWVFAAGAMVGLLAGAALQVLHRLLPDRSGLAIASVATALTAYLVAEGLGVSGVVAALVCGLMTNRLREEQDCAIDHLWQSVGGAANGAIFVLMGATLTLNMFTERWLAMLIGIGAAVLARAIAVYGAGLIARFVQPVSLREQNVLFWGGGRGGVTIALALMLPVELDYWWTVQSIAYGVVIFNLFVQAPTVTVFGITRDRG